MDLVELGTYRSQTEADLISAKLKAYGIDSLVDANLSASGLPNLELSQGVRVVVREQDLADALEVLERMLPSGD